MQNQDLINYIKAQLQKNVSKEAITQALIFNNFTQEEINEAFLAVEGTPPASVQPTPTLQTEPQPQLVEQTPTMVSKSKFPKVIILFIVLFILMSSAAGAYYFLMKSKTPSITPSPSPTIEPSPTAQPQAEIQVDPACANAHDSGYIFGLYGRDKNDIESLPKPISPECMATFDSAYEEGKRSASQQNASAVMSQRQSDLQKIAVAIFNYASANNGELPPGVDDSEKELGSGEGKLDLSKSLQNYLGGPVPFDPLLGSPASTGYVVFRAASGRIVVETLSAVDNGNKITVTR